MSDLITEARLDAKAFRENTVYDSEGDPIRLTANADRLDRYADRIAELESENARLKADKARMREALDRLLALGPDHDNWCAIGPIYNCTCDLHPARQSARAALKETSHDD